MNIKKLKKYLYIKDSTIEERKSFLIYIYNVIDNNFNVLDGLLKKACKKEKINDLLNEENININAKKTTNVLNSFDKIRMVDIYKAIYNCTKEIKVVHNEYLKKLKGQPIKYIIIGEAPPFSFTKTQRARNKKIEFKNNYILSKKNAGIWQSSIRGAFGISEEEKGNTPVKFIEGLVAKNILFFDIIPVTLPFSTDIRTGWISKKIGNKPLLISLLDLAIKKNVAVKKITIDPNVKVAFVTPPKTSISIFDYYSDKKLKITDEISVDITIINDNTTKKKYNVGQDIILPMYKANAMMGANAPSTELLKLALDL